MNPKGSLIKDVFSFMKPDPVRNDQDDSLPLNSPILSKATAKETEKLLELVTEEVKEVRSAADTKRDDTYAALQREKMQALVDHSRQVLFRCRTVFPFDLFPDYLIIEPRQVNLKRKVFFKTSHLTSIPIKNISDVIVQTSPFFATIKIVDRSFVENSFEMNSIKRNDAKKARKIIQGLIIAIKEGIDVGKIDTETLAVLSHELGEMQSIRE